MHDLNNSAKQGSLFSLSCRAGEHFPFVHSDEAKSVLHSCASQNRQHIVTCSDPELSLFLDDVSGLDVSGISLGGASDRLSVLIPVIPRQMFTMGSERVPATVVGITLNDILTRPMQTSRGRARIPEGSRLNQDVLQSPVFRGKRVILFSSGPDLLIETVWWKRHDVSLFQTLAGMGFLGVTGMNFSVISGECAVGQALNIKKSLVYSAELDALGVWSPPHVYASNPYQIRRWITWLNENPQIGLITMNSQLQHHRGTDKDEFFSTIVSLLQETKVHVLVQGGPNRMPPAVFPFLERLHFALAGPLKKSLIRKDRTPAEHMEDFRKSYARITGSSLEYV